MKVLIACEFSGIVRDAFIEKGHETISCDTLPTENEGPHYQGDVRWLLKEDCWDLIVAHPPCTRMANSGVRWLHERNLWNELKIYTNFFRLFLEHSCPRIAVENPIPHKYAVEKIGKYDQKIQPWQFGHPEKKATCLWLKGLPKLQSTNEVEASNQRIWKMPPSKQRQKERSRFFTGIAKAMANQWG